MSNLTKWAIGGLVVLGIASTWVASKLGGSDTPMSFLSVPCATAMVILDQKRRCGFVDLGRIVVAEGLVTRSKIHTDGDRSVTIIPDIQHRYLLKYKDQSRRTHLKAEFMPCERDYADVEDVLIEVGRRMDAGIPTRVAIMGRWAYDGVDHRGEFKDNLDLCLEAREPDPAVGWTEIHPAYSIEILKPVIY